MVSVMLTLAMGALVLSGLVLFVSPPGRVANWTDWRLLGLTKSTWGSLHIWFGTVFALTTTAHIYFNWRPLMSYFKARKHRSERVRPEWIVSATVALLVFVGTTLAVPPFVSLLKLNESIKDSWDTVATRAPIPHAERLTVAELAEQAGIPAETAVARLQAKALTQVSSEVLIQDLAAANQLSAKAVYEIIDPSSSTPGKKSLADGSGSGVGWKTLAAFCASEGIPLEVGLHRLAAAGITADPEQTLRDLARENGFSRPSELLGIVRQGEGSSH